MRVCAVFVVWMLCAAVLSAQTVDGRDVYQRACAACHGADGRGLPTIVLGFDTPVPDFTDCSFATPEANPDWTAIVHQGGPVRAFDRRMPAFGEALADVEIQALLDYVRTFCGDGRWPRGELNLPRALVTEKAFPENETVWTTAVSDSNVVNRVLYERRIGARSQFEAIVPFVARETSTDWRAGLGDVGLALKYVVLHSFDAGSIFSVGGEAVFPTGKETEGLGRGATVFEPFGAFGQMLPSDGFLQAHVGMELSTDGGRELFWRAAIGKSLVEGRFGRTWSPMIEVLADRRIGTRTAVHWDLLPQVQVSLSKRQHILINGGVRIPVNSRTGRDPQVLGYFLWDWFDGGLLDGWR